MCLAVLLSMLMVMFFVFFKQLRRGTLSCFASVSSETVPLPSGVSDKRDVVLLLKKVVKSFSPLLNDACRLHSQLNGVAARNTRWKAEFGDKKLA